MVSEVKMIIQVLQLCFALRWVNLDLEYTRRAEEHAKFRHHFKIKSVVNYLTTPGFGKHCSKNIFNNL